MNDTMFFIQFCRNAFYEIEFVYFFYNTWLLTGCDLNLSHTGSAQENIVIVKQEHEEVKRHCFLLIDLLFIYALR